jgi:pimeloyl-ACP methyl ester carboxylesterase
LEQSLPYARNALDGRRVYFEEDGGDGAPVVVHGGLLDSVVDLRSGAIAGRLPAGEFRLVYVDHRGLGRSDKPHDVQAYAMPLRVADAVAVLDGLGFERAHFIGMSWGGRLGFGICEHAPDRVISLVVGGQQPYAWPDSPLTRAITDGLAAARTEGMEALVQASRPSGASASRTPSGRAGSTTTQPPSKRRGVRYWLKAGSPRTFARGKSVA